MKLVELELLQMFLIVKKVINALFYAIYMVFM